MIPAWWWDQPARPISCLRFLTLLGHVPRLRLRPDSQGCWRSVPKVTSTRLHPKRTRYRRCPSGSCPGRLQEGEIDEGRRVKPLPSGAALWAAQMGFWVVPPTGIGPQGANPIPCQEPPWQPALEGSCRWKGAPCHASSSPATTQTEVCFSHSPGLHAFMCRAGAPAASPRLGAPLQPWPPVLIRYP